jgi:hypothetical protein
MSGVCVCVHPGKSKNVLLVGREGNGKKVILEVKDREVSGGGRNRGENGVRVRDEVVYGFNSVINEPKILDKAVGAI